MSEFSRLERVGEAEWRLPRDEEMTVDARLFADAATIDQLREETLDRAGWSALRQLRNVACLPGIVGDALAMPDVHPGYGFPIGGVAAFDLTKGVAVVGGVGFDINCGVRMMALPLNAADVKDVSALAVELFRTVPAGLGATGALRLSAAEIDEVLVHGAEYAIGRGFGIPDDLEWIEENGRCATADAAAVSDLAKRRQFAQMGTLGSGNHYLEIQRVEAIDDVPSAEAYGLALDQLVISIHTGSRALGHQIGQDYLASMGDAVRRSGLPVPERELACAPIDSPEGSSYLAAAAAGSNCAFANRQIIAHLVRQACIHCFSVSPENVRTVYDVGHNHARIEDHTVDGATQRVLVHRKGATRAFGPGHPASPARYRPVGHPVLVGGTMGTASYVLRGTPAGMERAFGSAIHGAGRLLSRKKAAKKYWGARVVEDLKTEGVLVYSHSPRGIAEEAPGAYKDVDAVVNAAQSAGIVAKVARLEPLAVIKG